MSVRGLFSGDPGLQHIPASNDPDGSVVDFNGIDNGADVGLAVVDIDAVEL